jgi:hypothetical protein
MQIAVRGSIENKRCGLRGAMSELQRRECKAVDFDVFISGWRVDSVHAEGQAKKNLERREAFRQLN